MSARRKARILAFQALYAWEAAHMDTTELLGFTWIDEDKQEKYDQEARDFAALVIHGVLGNLETVDKTIQAHLEHWTFDRLKKVDVAILRTAVYALLFQTDIPAQITIDEAIEIAKEYGSDDSFRFVNGVLDAVWKAQKSR